MSRTRAVLTATLLASALALGGCSDDDPQPKFAPSESTSAGVPTASDDGRAAEEHAVRAFFGGIDEALGTGDATAFMKMAAPACANCRVLADNLKDAYADGGRIVGGRWEVVSARHDSDEELGSIWTVDVRSARETWVDGNGKTVKIVRAGLQRFGVAVGDEGDQYRVRELRLVEQ